jgi:YihY family inner membrane protein
VGTAAVADRQKITRLDRLTIVGRSFLEAIGDIGAEGAIAHAASISYYTILSIFPFLLLVVVVSTRILSDPALSVQAIQWLGSYLPAGKEILLDSLPVLQRTSGSLGLFSVIGLAWSSMGLFSALRGALDQMMGVKTKSSAILTHWASLVSVIVSSFGLLVLIALSTILTLLGHVSLEGVSQTISRFGPLAAAVARWLLLPAGMALQLATLFLGQFMTWLAITLVLQYLPRKHPGWRNCILPAFVVTVFVEFLKSGFLWSIQSRGNFTVINGPLAAAIAFMLWAYLTALMLLFGAAWAKRLRQQRNMLMRRRVPDEY